MGKSYANRKPVEERPEQDFYSTPYCLTWKLIEQNVFPLGSTIYEPACGHYAITTQLEKAGFNVFNDDIIETGKDFLQCKDSYPFIITNPPFSLFDEFVLKAQEVSPKFAFIIKTNIFGAYQRNEKGVWDGLKNVYIFNRQVDYRSPIREDGLVYVGNLITAWGIWDRAWKGKYWKTSIVDIQPYCRLGQIK